MPWRASRPCPPPADSVSGSLPCTWLTLYRLIKLHQKLGGALYTPFYSFLATALGGSYPFYRWGNRGSEKFGHLP